MDTRPVHAMIARSCLCLTLATLSILLAPQARAEMIMLAQTTLVTGTDSNVATITLPSPGTLTVDVSNIPWPQSLASLNFMLSSSNQVISAWSTESTTVESYNLMPGTYFAHLTGTAGGSLDLGLYSITVGFQPAGVVPLPPSGTLLLLGLSLLLWLALSGKKGRLEASAAV